MNLNEAQDPTTPTSNPNELPLNLQCSSADLEPRQPSKLQSCGCSQFFLDFRSTRINPIMGMDRVRCLHEGTQAGLRKTVSADISELGVSIVKAREPPAASSVSLPPLALAVLLFTFFALESALRLVGRCHSPQRG